MQKFLEEQIDYDPAISYSTGLATTDHSRFADRSPQALAAVDAKELADLNALRDIDPRKLPSASRPTYANLKEVLESSLQLRVCKTELWNVNHFDGWQSQFAAIAEHQPVATPNDRKQALQRWSSLPLYIDTEIANLRQGLAAGYSAPQSVVRKVIAQMDQLTSTTADHSPFYSPAARSGDLEFRAKFSTLIVDRIDPALQRYRNFLQSEYLPKARVGVAISDLPHGPECYQAFLRSNTTLQRSAQEIFDLGNKTVDENTADVIRLGKEFEPNSTPDISKIVARVKADPNYRFQSKEKLLTFATDLLAEARSKTASRTNDLHAPAASDHQAQPRL